MGRFFGILMIVIALWVGVTVYTEGLDHAFGGRLGFLSSPEDGDQRRPTERARDAVSQAHAEAESRREKLLRD